MAEVAAHMSYQAYLDLESESDARYEYVAGQVFAMAGGSPEHARLRLAVGAELRAALANKRCAVFGSELKLRIDATDRSTYADASVFCEAPTPSTHDRNALTDPQVVVEVLSPGTEASDRGEKFAHYRKLPSLKEYVLVTQDAPRVEVFRRGQGGEWILRSYGVGENAALPSLGIALSVDAIYRDPLG
ncbi:MAG: Uma2 family endonuclease [Myxococcota bacterium]